MSLDFVIFGQFYQALQFQNKKTHGSRPASSLLCVYRLQDRKVLWDFNVLNISVNESLNNFIYDVSQVFHSQ